MRILYHHRTRLEDAQGIHVTEMVRAFRELGHEVQVVSLVDREGSDGGALRSLPNRLPQRVPNWLYEAMGLGYNLYGYRSLAGAITERQPHLIYERYSLNTMCGIWASRRFGVPLFLEVNAPLCYEQRDLGKLTFGCLARRTERWVCSNSTRTIAVSGVLKDMLAEEGVPRAHVTVMPNGINPREFHPGVDGTPVRQRYGLEGKVVVGVVGWFRKWHGIDMLVETMHHGGLLNGKVRVLLAGDGPATATVREYVKANRLLESVVFTVPVPRLEIPAHIAAIDIAVQPAATAYACPMKLIEYMAMGRCIVAPDQPNVRELVGEKDSAFLFAKGARESLKAALREAIRDPAKRQVAGWQAFRRVRERQLLWRENAQRVLDLLSAHTHRTRASERPVS